MNAITLENNQIIVEINEKGGELTRLFSKEHDKEILWNGDSRFWCRRSPLLFPIIGRLVDDEALIDGEFYKIDKHGFARDSKFDLIHSDLVSATFSLKANEATRKVFPYEFEVIIKYSIDRSSIKVEWNVINHDNRLMYFSIGGHPAFNIPYYGEDFISDYSITMESLGDIEEYMLRPPFIDGKKVISNPGKIIIKPELFNNDAKVFGNVNKVTIASDFRDMKIVVDCNGFPYVGIWSPYYERKNAIAPFVCIEPWYGLPDPTDSNKIFNQKIGINKVEPSKMFEASYNIEIV